MAAWLSDRMPQPEWMSDVMREQHTRQQHEQLRQERLRGFWTPPSKEGAGNLISFPGGIIGVILVAAAMVVIGGFYLKDDPEPPPVPAGQLALVTPETLQGRPLNGDSQFDKGRELVRTQLATVGGTDKAYSLVYGTSNDDLIYVGVAKGSYTNVDYGVDVVIRAVEADRPIRDYHPVDPGPLGGSAKCGTFTAYGINVGVCAWVDSGTIGELAFYNTDGGKAGRMLAAARGELERRV